MSGGRNALPKPIFYSPAQLVKSAENASSASESNEQMDALMAKFQFPEELDKSKKQMQKDEHKKRLANLRTKELQFIAETNWMFSSTSNGPVLNNSANLDQ